MRIAFLLLFVCAVASAQPDLAPLKVLVNDTPEPGYLLLAPNCRVSPRPYGSFLGVYNVNGGVLRTGRVTNFPFEYKVFPDGRLGYSELVVFAGASVPAGVYIVDTLLAPQEFVSQSRGYLTTQHDFHMLPNGNMVVLGAEDVTIDMSAIVPGGHPAANVVNAVIQEIDRDGRVVVQWKALDHLPITDSYEDLAAPAIRFCHNNSLWIDDDGNWIISMRHMSQVIKVNRSTGEVMWKLGGKSNQFTFIGDHPELAPTFFSYQHDARRLPNGNVSIFDNGTQHTPQYSRGVEYRLDEQAKTATMVWEYRHVPDYYVSIQGGLQTLPNGNRVLGWGSAANDGAPGITEVDSTGRVVFEAAYPKQMFVYRATKYPVWPTGRPSATVVINDVLSGEQYAYWRGTQYTGTTVTFRSLESSFYNRTTVRRFAWSPKNPQWTVESPHIHQSRIELLLEGIRNERIDVRFNIDTLGITFDPTTLVVYHRQLIDSGRFQPLSTRFDAAARELVVEATTGGEFCFGIPQVPVQDVTSPLLAWPVGGERILERATHDFKVTPNGRVDSIRIQVSRDPSFTTGVVDLSTTSDRTAVGVDDASYKVYWRAMAFAGGRASVWSAVDSASVAPAYLDVTRPTTDVQWAYDNAYAISWRTNVRGLVRIELVKDNQVVARIADSVLARAQGFLWKVPFSVPAGREYHVRVSSIDPSFVDIVTTGTQNITITDVVSVAEDRLVQGAVTIAPVPANDRVTVSNVASGIVSIDVYAITGERVATQASRGTREQLSTQQLPPGIYTVLVTDTRGIVYRAPLIIAR